MVSWSKVSQYPVIWVIFIHCNSVLNTDGAGLPVRVSLMSEEVIYAPVIEPYWERCGDNFTGL